MNMGEEAVAATPRNNRVKFMCSYGGRILPRPADGQLKYVGGTTRVIAVPRDITFQELMKKVGGLFEGEGDLVLKYQLIPEELDALVSVTCDEDLSHMLDEYDRRSTTSNNRGSPRLRTFLFPSTPITIGGAHTASLLEQRYIDAINGIVHYPSNASSSIFTISSAGSSPKSFPPETTSNSDPDAIMLCSGVVGCTHCGRCTQQHGVHKVHSSPNLLGMGPRFYQHSHSANFPLGRPMMTTTQVDSTPRHQMGLLAARRYYSPVGPCRWSGVCSVCGHVDGCGAYRSGGVGAGVGDGLPQSPMMKQRWGSPRSPLRHGWE